MTAKKKWQMVGRRITMVGIERQVRFGKKVRRRKEGNKEPLVASAG